MRKRKAATEAAEWLALMGSEQWTAERQEAFKSWCRQHPQQAALLDRLQGRLASLHGQGVSGIPVDSLIHSLNGSTSRRRLLRGGAGLLSVVAVGWLTAQVADSQGRIPGVLSTGTAERRTFVLADGSQLVLDACSRVDVLAERGVGLQQGQICLRVASASAWQLHLAGGVLSLAENARVVAQNRGAVSTLSLLAGAAQVLTSSARRQSLEAGQSVRLDATGLYTVGSDAFIDDAWLTGWLRVENRSLAEVVAALRNYRSGFIRIDPRAETLRVSGLYPLDDSDTALRLLADSLGLVMRYRSRFWVSLELGESLA